MTEEQRRRLRGIKTFKQLIEYLKDELQWEIPDVANDDDLTFDWSDDLGLKESERVGIKEIKQLRPLASGQPWGIFFINFEKKKLPIVILRRILNALVMKKRASANKSQQAAWKQHDLLFISAYGEEGDDRQITFAHFSEPTGELTDTKPTLRVLGWDANDANLALDYVSDKLHEKLTWPADTKDLKAWRQRWSEAFELRHRQVIETAQDLAQRLAELAQRIRDRAEVVLGLESEKGALRTLMKGFRTALIHDLDEKGFADMYAQTITYGLFSAAVSRTVPGAGTAVVQEDMVAMVPVTNPFLKEMLESFIKAGGRKGKLDFDELGIQEVVDLLRDPKTRLAAVLRDFGNKTRGEDPVIHFYEHFLSAYNKKLKIQRGVFYTPQPVVSYIVRSVHELLQTEFGLADGLADTTTWGEMLKRFPPLPPGEGRGEGASGLRLPPLTDEPDEKRTISPDEPFVQILDPATGTATFLVEVIAQIAVTMKSKWGKALELQIPTNRDDIVAWKDPKVVARWNDYVPQHLLPRLHAFELMMAPYAIAHMKIGLKLAETGYRFGVEERARIYLTNALEPWVKQLPLIGFDALAHESAAVNEIKRHKRFTVVIGNPPYSNFGQLNRIPFILKLLNDYKRGLKEQKLNLDDDFIKFIRLSQNVLNSAGVGVLGMITNNVFIDGITHRRMRESLLETFSDIRVVDLHGSAKKLERAPDGSKDENVFDIQQGVGISLFVRPPRAKTVALRHSELFGLRSEKYQRLSNLLVNVLGGSPIRIVSPYFFFVPKDFSGEDKYREWPSLVELMPTFSTGVKTHLDDVFVGFSDQEIHVGIEEFLKQTWRNVPASEAKRSSPLRKAVLLKTALRASQSSGMRNYAYRSLDDRRVIYLPDAIEAGDHRYAVMRHMVDGTIAIAVTRQLSRGVFCHALVTKNVADMCLLSTATKECAYVFPMRLSSPTDLLSVENSGVNLSSQGRAFIQSHQFTPEELFRSTYALLHSPEYRSRYAEFLKIDFPRVPLVGNLELFRALARLGGELTALHLLESPKLDKPITEFIGGRNPEVEKVSWSKNTVWTDKAQTIGFKGVPEDVWTFHIGGYQVCEKWLKDRKGRTLSKDDIAHYQKIVVALSETIRLMAEIDRVIEQHGGWPTAFQGKMSR